MVSERGWSDGLLEAGFGDAVTAELVGWPARVARMVEVEAALGRALAATGLIPEEAAEAIARACDTDRLDLDALAARAATSATPVIPLVALLREDAEPGAAAWLHHGATSQDVIDTAAVLTLRDALGRLEEALLAVADRCADLAQAERATVMAGRTLGQQAVPITFGLKAARWLGALDRRIAQLREVRERALVVQIGGAAGSSAVYGADGPTVASHLADALGLAVPDLPWHAERDRVVELAGCLTALVTVVSTVAADVILLSSTEIGEVAEIGDGPQSSAMPHKRNPVHATAARAAARLALGELGVLVADEHANERGTGGWQAEWVALPSALVRTVGAVERLRSCLAGLRVDAERARRNMEQALGLTASEALLTALTPELGRRRAAQLTGQLAVAARDSQRSLGTVAAEDPRINEILGPAALDSILDPAHAVRGVDELIDCALATHRRTRGEVS